MTVYVYYNSVVKVCYEQLLKFCNQMTFLNELLKYYTLLNISLNYELMQN